MKWTKRVAKQQYRESDLLIEKLAKVRGVKDLSEWLAPTEMSEHNELTLINIEELADRIIKAIKLDEKIVVFADVDLDGVCSCSIMYNYLKRLTNNVSYIHAQRSDGHGLETVKDVVESDIDLLIAVDSSTNSVEASKVVKEKGIDILVIDHHEKDVENPYVLLTNCQVGGYKNKSLSGSAMVYKVCKVLDRKLEIELSEDYIDLCAIGLIGDMMNVSEPENRYLIHKGLRNIGNKGLTALMNFVGIKNFDNIDTTSIAYRVAPMINACTRFNQIELVLELFTNEEEERILELVQKLDELNKERKKKEEKIVKEAIEKVDNRHSVAVLIDNTIDSGFRGLIAMQLVTKLKKPVLVLVKKGDVVRGSSRTYSNIPFKSLCNQTELFEHASGHEGAFGVGIKLDNLESALEKLDELLEGQVFEDEIFYDLELEAIEITENDIRQVELFSAITGSGFSKPSFLIKGVMVDEVQLMGKNKNVAKIKSNGLDLIKFKAEESIKDELKSWDELDVIGTLNINEWFNKYTKKLVTNNQVIIENYLKIQ
jgi:single-stranded-DNA-specific exonuclease